MSKLPKMPKPAKAPKLPKLPKTPKSPKLPKVKEGTSAGIHLQWNIGGHKRHWSSDGD